MAGVDELGLGDLCTPNRSLLGQARSRELANFFWKDPDPEIVLLRVGAFLSWPLLRQAFAEFAAQFLGGNFNPSVPPFEVFLGSLQAHLEKTVDELYTPLPAGAAVEDHYAHCILKLLVPLLRKGSDAATDQRVTWWLGPDSRATTGDKVWILYHTLMLMHLEECHAIYKDSSLVERARITVSSCVNHFASPSRSRSRAQEDACSDRESQEK
ncbi:hypothetical protein GQ53DRAFT_759631 [Thozetella sp. PMI_491]|nr:hypothetical protein GQ53DRAFT_759631 [Thozetella sp. PMI_491]